MILEPQLRDNPQRATVHRYWDEERLISGYVIMTPRGWALSYRRGDDDDETIFHLGTHPLLEGQYLTITDSAGEPLPMRVAGIVDVE